MTLPGSAASMRYQQVRALVADEPEPSRSLGAGPPDGPARAVIVASGLVPLLQRLCRSMSRALGTTGAAVGLISGQGSQGVAAASDARCHAYAELEFTAGEGPCLDAYAARRPVLVADLDQPSVGWPGYTSALLETGVRAVFAFPLQVGIARVGVLETLAERPGPLVGERLELGLAFAAVATDILLDGRLLTDTGELTPAVASALGYRAEIHRAQGMTMVALDLDLTESLVRMRSFAFSHDEPLVDVARRILAGDVVMDGPEGRR